MYFKKVSLGGVRDPEKIIGFARTWSGATPGVIAKGQLEGGTSKVMYCFDELEKIQNEKVLDTLLSLFDHQKIFADNYYGVNIDISKSMFTMTTNDFTRLPAALRNRVQVIHIGDYGPDVKTKIANSKLAKAAKNYKLTDKVEFASNLGEAIQARTSDKGGRDTVNLVDELINKIINKLEKEPSPSGAKLIVDRKFLDDVQLGKEMQEAAELYRQRAQNQQGVNFMEFLARMFNGQPMVE